MPADITEGTSACDESTSTAETEAIAEVRPVASETLRAPRAAVLRDNGIFLACAVLFAFLAFANGHFLTSSNLLNLVDEQSSIGFIALAGTLVVIAGCFDLSVGAIYAMSGVVLAKVTGSVGPVEGIVCALLAGAALGAINGTLVSFFKVNPLIATLATSIIFGGVTLVITNGFLLTLSNHQLSTLGNSKPLGVYWSTWLLLAFAVVMGILLTRTRFGRYLFAVGGSEEAARLSGVRPGLVRTAAYTLSGFACGLGATLYTSRVQTADPNLGASFALTAIAAIVVGGTSISGGEGGVSRTVAGVLLLGLITDGFNLLAINPLYQQIVQGTIILAAVGLDVLGKRNRR